MSSTVRASISLAGAIVGVGIFGVPFVFAQAGVGIGLLFFVVLTAVILVQHLMYAEVIERTHGTHRITGYAQIYFGKGARDAVGAAVLISRYGTQLAYIVVANIFLNTLFGELLGVSVLWGIVFGLVLSVGIVLGIKAVARGEVYLFGLLFVIFTFFIIIGIPRISFENFTSLHPEQFFLPYGVILFSLAGAPAIPEIRDIIRKKSGKEFRNAVIAGTLFAAALTLIFGIVVLGVSGESTSAEAVSGLLPYLGRSAVYLGALLGLFAAATSFLIFGVNLKETFLYDWKLSRPLSEMLAAAVPLLLFMLGFRNFIDIIGITGALFGVLLGVTIVALFIRAKKVGKRSAGFSMTLSPLIIWLIVILLVGGGIYEIIEVLL